MYQYTKDMLESYKFKFTGIESIEHNYSQSLQDMFVLSVLNGKRLGTYLEIGADQPININNTYMMEHYFGWKGVSIDIVDNYNFKTNRLNGYVLADATTLNYTDICTEFNLGNQIDYLSLDIEPNDLTLKALKQLPLDKIRFSVITYETDFYRPDNTKEHNIQIRNESRSILESHGYIRVNGNVADVTPDYPFEDWYVDPNVIDKSIIDKFMRLDDNPYPAHLYLLD